MVKSCRFGVPGVAAAISLSALLVLGLSGCGQAVDTLAPGEPSLSAQDAANGPDSAASYDRVDVDLSQLSGQVAYGQVYQMMVDPAAYEGQVVRASGPLWFGEYKGERYPAVIIQDATACCANGFEFECADEDGLPDEGAEVTVTGIFEMRRGGDVSWVVLADAQVERA